MKQIGKVAGVLGVASACGLMALPLSTFAIEKKNSLDVNVTIASFLNITSGASTVADTINPGQVKNLTNTIRVKTNSVTGYNINIRDKDSNTNLVHDTTTTSTIPTVLRLVGITRLAPLRIRLSRPLMPRFLRT